MSYRRIRAMFIKELHHVTRDSRSLSMALAMPVMMLLLYGYALSLDVDHIPTLVYDQDGTAASRDLTRQFQGSQYFDVAGFVTDYHAIEHAIDTSRVLIGVSIPRGFGRDLEVGKGKVQLLVDGSDSNTASIAMGYAESVVQSYSAVVQRDVINRKGMHPPGQIDARMRVWYNSSLESKNFIVPGLIGVIMVILAGQLSSLTIAREWEMGTMEQVLSTPLRPTEIVLGKMLAYFLVGLVDSVIAIVVSITVFTVPFRGSFLVLGISTCAFLWCALFTGIWVSAGTRSQVQAYQFGILVSFLPGFLLSGFTFSIDTMPKVIQGLSYFFPARYYVTIVKGVFLKGVDFRILWGEMGFLALYGALIFWRTVKKMNQKVA
ncbi:MAG TPA: ABC transporter permease [Bryobacteraceae bacterium]|jgi:ABC-2 type transport system permease protein|nr:ABC transporter permease [Bryobacteraceae bacterium]